MSDVDVAFMQAALQQAGEAALAGVAYEAAWSQTTTGVWIEPAWSRGAVWGLPALLTVAGFLRTRRRRPPLASSAGEPRGAD